MKRKVLTAGRGTYKVNEDPRACLRYLCGRLTTSKGSETLQSMENNSYRTQFHDGHTPDKIQGLRLLPHGIFSLYHWTSGKAKEIGESLSWGWRSPLAGSG